MNARKTKTSPLRIKPKKKERNVVRTHGDRWMLEGNSPVRTQAVIVTRATNSVTTKSQPTAMHMVVIETASLLGAEIVALTIHSCSASKL